MKKIDLEAHFYTEEYERYLRTRKEYPTLETVEDETHHKLIRLGLGPNVTMASKVSNHNRLVDLEAERLKAMDEAGIDMQVLSLSVPGCEQFEAEEGTAWARKVNDELSVVIKKHPDRFIGLAALAPQDPDGAAGELERAVKELGLSGAKINSHVRGEYLDAKKYWVIFEAAEKLGVPIYIHPNIPSPSILKPYSDYGFALAGPVLGFGAETSLHAMRLIYSGVFDKYPGLKIILGHLGEALPFWLWRIDFFWLKQWPGAGNVLKLEKKPSDCVKDNFIMTTSGVFFQPAFMCTYLALGADRIAFAVDYPYEEDKNAVQFMESTPICDSDKEKICHLNAEKLFNIV